MSKQIRTLIIVTVALIVTVGLLLSLLFLFPSKTSDTSSEATSSDTAITLVSKTTSKGETVEHPIKSIAVTTASEKYTISLNSAKQLVVDAYADLPINTTDLSTLETALTTVTATRKLTSDSASQSDFGLDKPQAKAVVTYFDNSVVTVEIGSKSPAGDGYYARVSGNEAIYLIDATLAEQLLKKSTDYIGTAAITSPSVKSDDSNGKAILQDMKLSGTVRSDKPFAFRLVNSTDSSLYSYYTYISTSPYVNGIGSDADTIASNATSLTASSVVKAHPSEKDLASYGLVKPYSVCEMTLSVQTTSTNEEDVSTTKYYNAAKHTIKLGNKDSSGNYYALVDDYKVVYLLTASTVPWADSKYDTLAADTLFMLDIKTVSSITYQNGKSETTFKLEQFPKEEDSDNQLKVTVNGKKYPTADFRTLYQVFMSVGRYDSATSKPAGDPDIVLTVKSTQMEFVAKLYTNTASTYICKLNNGDMYTVKSSDVANMIQQVSNYLSGKTVTAQ